jgi:deoxyribodipyrimidine photo-lyase
LFEEADLGYPRCRFWHDALQDLQERCDEHGTPLAVRQGEPPAVISTLVAETGADAVYTNRSYTPYGRERDAAVAEQVDVPLNRFKDVVLHDRDEIMSKSGSAYQVFSYYRDKWFTQKKRQPADVPEFTMPDVSTDTVPTLTDLGIENPGIDAWWTASRDAGLDQLDTFMDVIGQYDDCRDLPAEDATSRLSPHLKFGTISIREAYWAAENARKQGADRDGVRTWEEELAWRDFYFQMLWHHPETTDTAFREQYQDISWQGKKAVPERWDRWTAGRTGFPFVDAGMRQLRETGWMHNRLRMVVTSFACKDLWLDWRDVHQYFNQWFVDADIPSMIGGIQWAYSIGTDAQPYFRIFNPFKQGKEYDPDGTFIREWVDELADVPDDHIHRPHEMSPETQDAADCVIGDTYPAPIVDHQEQRENAIERFKTVKDEN